MTGRYPEAVDVAIVGSGPAGAAYARILSERAPGASIAVFEVGPTVTNPPASSRKVATKSPALAAELSQSRFPVAA